MELTQLRYFLKTAETLNYTKAAEAVFTSRQALCHALGNLEKELGQPLFSNDRNRLSLTEYGIYLLRTFEDLVRDFEDRETQVKEFFRQPVILRVSFSVPGVQCVCSGRAPRALPSRLRRGRPVLP